MIRFSKASRLLTSCATFAIALGAAPAFAQADAIAPRALDETCQTSDDVDVYVLRFSREVADGRAVVSTSHDTIVARGRHGDRSLMLHDIQAGAVTIERAEGTGALALNSERRIDASYSYDYGAQHLVGSGGAASAFNSFLRPLIAQGPPLGRDASWTVATALTDLGLAGDDRAPLNIVLSRTYLTHAGEQLVLVEFDVPVFAYSSPEGDAVVHWARGFAVTDASFTEIHALGTQHRAAVTQADGQVLPVSVRTSLHGIDHDGGWRMNFADTPAIRAAVERLVATAGDQVHATTTESEAAPIQPYAALVGARLDMAALAIGEGGANPMPSTLDAAMGPSPDAAQSSSVERNEVAPRRIVLRRIRADTGPSAQTNDDASPEAARDFLLRSDGSQSLQDAANAFGEAAPSGQAESSAHFSVRNRMLEGLNNYIQNDYAQMQLNPDATALTYRSSEERQLGETIGAMREEANAPEMSVRNRMLQGLNNYIQNDYSQMRLNPDATALTYRSAEPRELGDTIGFMRDAALDDAAVDAAVERARLDRIVREMAQAAAVEEARNRSLRLTPLQQSDDAGPPAWLQDEWRQDPSRRESDDTLYRLLRAELEREEAEARRDERHQQQRAYSGIDSLDEFVRNNAFEYTSLIGVVETDLSRWEEWLATQNERELERLARLIGYPNLASALNDAPSLIRHAQDAGYRNWAMQAPSCGGTVGCGPSYLERWWAKQATVLLGDILADSRDIFSSGGFSDIGISTLNLAYLLRDHALEDGDIVRVRISQFGQVIYEGQVNLTNIGDVFDLMLGRGVASLEIFAVNEGSARPNTAEITVDDVVRGESTQTYSLATGETATLRIEAGARPGSQSSGGNP